MPEGVFSRIERVCVCDYSSQCSFRAPPESPKRLSNFAEAGFFLCGVFTLHAVDSEGIQMQSITSEGKVSTKSAGSLARRKKCIRGMN